MYEYRKMTAEDRAAAVEARRSRGFPWHRPPHPEAVGEYRLVTGTCFEHRKILHSAKRLAWFEAELLRTFGQLKAECAAWCVLPNHYHVLVQIADIKAFAKAIGHLHGRTSFEMNREDHARGKRVWYNYQDRVMRSESHFFTSLNYVHNNPVKHGYVKRWQEWPFSSVHAYLETMGRDWLLDLWLRYPVLQYGKGWDEDNANGS
jgi:putative transposase